jgi:hypothetical protein
VYTRLEHLHVWTCGFLHLDGLTRLTGHCVGTVDVIGYNRTCTFQHSFFSVSRRPHAATGAPCAHILISTQKVMSLMKPCTPQPSATQAHAQDDHTAVTDQIEPREHSLNSAPPSHTSNAGAKPDAHILISCVASSACSIGSPFSAHLRKSEVICRSVSTQAGSAPGKAFLRRRSPCANSTRAMAKSSLSASSCSKGWSKSPSSSGQSDRYRQSRAARIGRTASADSSAFQLSAQNAGRALVQHRHRAGAQAHPHAQMVLEQAPLAMALQWMRRRPLQWALGEPLQQLRHSLPSRPRRSHPPLSKRVPKSLLPPPALSRSSLVSLALPVMFS